MKNIKLKHSLLLVPSTVILITFGVILITFNLAINHYIEEITAKRMNQMFDYFDTYFNDPMDLEYSYSLEDEFIVPVYHILLDDRDKVLFPGPPWSSSHEKERTFSIENYVRENPSIIRTANAVKLSLNKETFYLKSKTYRGEFDGYFITKNLESSKNYTLLVYTNITPIQSFLDLLNEILIFLMIGFGILSILAIFGMAKKIDHSLSKLKNSLIRIGNREPLMTLDPLPYEELNDVASTMQAMAKMIDRAEESQRQFFQNASHELRTPLMSIQGYAEGIYSGVIKNEMKASEIILSESQKMSALVDEILFLSKMDLDAFKEHREKICVQELLYDCSTFIKNLADQAQISIDHHFSTDKLFIFGDEKLLERAISNILSNAVRYARQSIAIFCDSNDPWIIIKITDDGEGISPNELPHIFERFFKGKGGNFGIGLSIAHDIVDAHGGTITATSDNGITEFTITLPKTE